MEYVSSFERKNTSKDLRPNNEKHSNVNMFVNNFKGRRKMLGETKSNRKSHNCGGDGFRRGGSDELAPIEKKCWLSVKQM
ncbi:hypothetical protein P8452_72007 [Trifolium repens]|nr:hypothetical protein P8452_72007 [Trifolium repens]